MVVACFQWDMSNTATEGKENSVSDPTDKDEELPSELDLGLDLFDFDRWQLGVCKKEPSTSDCQCPTSGSNSTNSGPARQCSTTNNVPLLAPSQHDHARYVVNVPPHFNSSLTTNANESCDTKYSPDGTPTPGFRHPRWKVEDGPDGKFSFIIL